MSLLPFHSPPERDRRRMLACLGRLDRLLSVRWIQACLFISALVGGWLFRCPSAF